MASLHQNDEIVCTDITTAKYKSSDTKVTICNMSINNHIEKRYDDIVKSPNDKREYRGLLLTNKMKILLISDPTTDKGAAALNVNIGYLSDPPDLPGLAHFCEHMLFLEKLRGALDRFAQFFITPLFTETLTELELNAIHSEYEKNLANDIWRIDQIEKSSADPNHPFSKFASGNKETLDVIPKQNNINVRERLLQFHKKFYSSNLMALCVLGKESLDDLQNMVVELFSQVENKKIEVPVWPEHPFNEEHFQTKWYIVPIKDVRHLSIIFPIPDLRKYYNSAPAHYISHLLGHEGEGSLLSALKAKGWCNSLKSVKWIYEEYRDVANMNFRFKEKSIPCDDVSSIARILYDYPMEEILVVPHLFPLWEPDLIWWVMKFLKPEDVRIHVIGKLYEDIANETEKWYGTKFKKEKIPQDIINKWINAGLNTDLKLPPKNEFIPEKFDLKPLDSNITKFPMIIEDTPLLRLWFKQDDEFFVPKANLFINFVSPVAFMDPFNSNSTYMFVLLFRDALNEYAYAADIAGLRWDLSNSKYGMILEIGGYNDKQHVLLQKIMDKMVNFKIDPKRFEIVKENHIRNLENYEAEQPYQRAFYYLAVLLSEHVWTMDELLQAAIQLTVEKLQQFIPQFLSKIHMECLIHGNITLSEAIETGRLIESKLVSTLPQMIPLLPRQLISHREIKLENGCHFLFTVKHKYYNTSCTQIYYQTGLQSTKSDMILELLAQILSEPCFTTLRTKEQLGYIVYSGVRRANGTQGLRIIVQSDRHPKYIEQRISIFLNSMLEYISAITEEEFNAHKESLAVQYLEKPKKLTILSTIFWNEILLQQCNFNRVNIGVAYLRTITKEQILQFYKDVLQSDIQPKISVHILPATKDSKSENEDAVDPNKDSESDTTNTVEYKVIDDILSFKVSQCLYPLVPPFGDVPRKGVQASKL
ncbi:Insulin-degrading enzyme [Anthophora quadrimaculata]